MAEVPKTTGSEFSPLPPRPPSPPLSGATAKLKRLNEEQLEEMLSSLPDFCFERPERGKPVVRSITTLNASQKANLFTFIPIEQQPSPSTPCINEAIEEKRKYDLQNICKNPIYCHPNLNVPLPPFKHLPTLPPQLVQAYLDELTRRVSNLMKAVHFTPKNESPDALLRDPIEMAELLTRYSFAEILQSDPSTLFKEKHRFMALISKEANKLSLAYKTMKKALTNVPIQPPLEGDKLDSDLSKILSSLNDASQAEDFKNLCTIAIETCVKLEVERNNLITKVREYLYSREESLDPFLPSELPPTLLQGPPLGEEEMWISILPTLEEGQRPYLYLIEKTRQFLAPYLSKEITSKNENVARGELKDSFLPGFHEEFKDVPASMDAWIEYFLLNAYLKIAAQGINLENLDETAEYYRELEKQETANGYVEAARLHAEQAVVIEEAIESYLKNFATALKHSLKIDFKSMELTNKEIKWLANYTLYNPTTPLPSDWKKQANKYM